MENRKPIFMIHKHKATHLHYDLRIEIENNLKSWALRKIPIKIAKAEIAIRVSDHPFWYRHFEGVIPEGKYGAGPVMIWDKGLYSSFMRDYQGNIIPIERCLEQGVMMLWLEGHKLKGGYILIKITRKQRWLMIKMEDNYVYKNKLPLNWQHSIKSGKTLNQINKEYKQKSKV